MKGKKLVALLLALTATAAIGGLTSCADKTDDPDTQLEQTQFTVSFDTQGGSAVSEQGVFGNGKVTEPGAPTKYGYDFIGWYKTADGNEKWNFETDVVKGHTTIYARWEIKDATADTYFDFASEGDGVTISVKAGQTLPADVVLPSQHEGKKITAIKDGAFEGQAAVKSVLVPDTVKNIGGRAFRNCANLEQVLGAENVETIGGAAFSGTKYDSNLSGGEVYLGKCLYKYAGGMYTDTEVTVKEGTLGIAAGAFQDMQKLTKVTLPNGLKYIGNYAFGGTTNGTGLKEVVIPESVLSVGDNAFRNAKSLATVTVGKGVKEIGASAFAGTAITNLTYNANATVNDNSFATVSAASTVTFGNDVTALPVNVTNKFTGLTTVTLGTGITEIPESAFEGLSSLATVNINGTLTSIGALAFKGTGITEFTVNKEITSIGGNAFANCANLATVNYNAVNATGTTASALAFTGCSKLKTVTVGAEVTAIPAYLFKNCAALDTLTLGANVASIGTEAFYGTAIATLTVPAKVATIGNSAFGNCAELATVNYNATNATYEGTTTIFAAASSVTIGGGVTKIPAYFVKGNTVLTSVTLPAGVSVGDYAFNGCTALATIGGYDTVGTVGAQAFEGSKYYEDNMADGLLIQGSTITGYRGEMPANFTLNAQAIPAGKTVTAIAAEAFKNQTNLVAVALPATVTTIGANAFEGTSVADTVDLSNVTEIGAGAFKGLTGVTAVTLNASVSKIGAEAFSGCSEAVMTLTANSLTELGAKAFYNCAKLTSVEVNGVAEIPVNCFTGAGLTSVTLGNTVETVGDSWATLDKVTTFAAPALKHIGNYGLKNLKVTDYSVENVVSFGVGALQGFALSEVVFGENCETLGNDLFTYFLQIGMQNPTITPTLTLTKVTFRNSKVTKIPDNAFRSCTNLTTVELCDSITQVGNYAFTATGLTSFDFTHVTTIGDYSFCDTKLTAIDLGAVTEVPSYAFNNNKTLKSVTVHGATKTVGVAAFRDSAVTTVTLEEGVQTVDVAAFMNCSIKEITLPSTIKSIGDNAFNVTKQVNLNSYIDITSVTLGAANNSKNSFSSTVVFVCKDDTVKKQYLAEDSAWKNAAGANWDTVWVTQFLTVEEANNDWVIAEDGSLTQYTGSKTNIAIPADLKSITNISQILGTTTNNEAAYTAVESITVAPESTSFKMVDSALLSYDETILYFLLPSCTSFSSDTVTEVKSFAAYNHNKLTSLSLPNAKAIGTSAFASTGITTLSIDKVETLSNYAFKAISGIDSITLEHVKTFGMGIFEECTNLRNVVVGTNCTSFSAKTFKNCAADMVITVKATTPPRGSTSMFGAAANYAGKIYVPAESVDAYKAANGWSAYADKIQAIPAEGGETGGDTPVETTSLEALPADNKNN